MDYIDIAACLVCVSISTARNDAAFHKLQLFVVVSVLGLKLYEKASASFPLSCLAGAAVCMFKLQC